MRKQVLYFLVLVFCMLTSNLYAQSDADALRFSMQNNTGTSRNIGVGNTLGSVGGDISNINNNPAGLGRISSTEFSITPAIAIFNSNAEFIGNSLEDNKLKFQLYNVGAVFGSKFGKSNTKWKGVRFGFSYNRLANLNQNFYLSGYNAYNSLVDHYYEVLDSLAITLYDAENNFPFGASLAYNTDLIYFDTTDNRLYSAINNGNVQQDITIQRKGGLDEAAIAIASNYDNKFSVGATIGLPILNYTDKVIHKETDKFDSSYSFNFFEQTATYNISGLGVNMKIGILAQPIKNLRLSLAFHTPSLLFLEDAFVTQIKADYVTYTADATSPDGLINYNLRLPWRLSTGASYVMKYGFVAVEYELSDAGKAKYNFKDADSDIKEYQSNLNTTIDEKYKKYHTIKLGAEGRFDPIRVRVGFQYQTNPFNTTILVNNQSTQKNFIYSGGIGFRKEHFYGDVAYQFIKGEDSYTPYTLKKESLSLQQTAINSFKRSSITLTFGYKF